MRVLKKLLTLLTLLYMNNTVVSSWDYDYISETEYASTEWTVKKNRKQHSFKAILLIYSTVYNCEHCNRKKEDCNYTYCDDEVTPPSGWDIGGW